ncbi:MAG: T9SS type A sorting domain-containing protein [Saprospiraceae bacterium]
MAPLPIQSITVSINVQSFDNAVFNADIFNQGLGDIYFQWQQSTDGLTWSDVADGDFGSNTISGANTSSLVIAPAAGYDGMQFRLVARTAVCPEIFTPSATLSVDGDQLSIIKDLPNETIETCGDELVILVFEYANAEGILADLTWERSYDGQNWTALQGGGAINIGHQPNVTGTGFYAILAINASYAFDGSIYRCRLVSSSGQVLNSGQTELRVLGPLDIEVQPENAAVCFNQGHTFSATISNPNGLAFNQYWMMSDDAGSTWEAIPNNSPTGFGGVFENTESADLTITSVEGLDGMYFRLIIENSACTAVSEPVVLTVEDSPYCYPASNFVDYKLKLRPDGQSWGVWVKAVGDFAATGDNYATSGRIVIAATAGFAYYDVQSQAGGTWTPGKYKLNAPETPGISYYTFDLTSNQSILNIQQGNEIMLFSFRRQGDCPAQIYLADEFVPAGMLPNEFTGVDQGSHPNQVFFLGDVYGLNEASCSGQNLIANPDNNPNINSHNGQNLTSGEMTIFPNPAGDWLEVRLTDMEMEDTLTHSILTANGAVVKTFKGHIGGQKIILEDLPKGLYFLTYEVNGKTMGGQKFIKN